MQRIPEPELMDYEALARAYAEADCEDAHARFIAVFRERFADGDITGTVLDLGCGPAEITVRFARAYPRCVVHGVDGAAAMLSYGERRVVQEGLQSRITLVHGYLPDAQLPCMQYEAVLSNSLLHHLRDPAALWRTLRACVRADAPVFVMDLLRPEGRAEAEALVEQYAANEPAVQRHDVLHSLLAAYRLDEVAAQLRDAGLAYLTIEAVSDRHLAVHGRMRAAA